MQVVPSGPVVREESIQAVLLGAIYAARRELVMTTPYFVPDESLVMALMSAALRGVEVTLVVPARVDSRLARLASQPHKGELLEAGVRIAEFQGGLLHTKSVTVDGELSLFGSLNLDPRSLILNFEITLCGLRPGVHGRRCGRCSDRTSSGPRPWIRSAGASDPSRTIRRERGPAAQPPALIPRPESMRRAPRIRIRRRIDPGGPVGAARSSRLCAEGDVSMREPIILLAIALPAVLLFVTLYWLDRVRRREALFRWASKNGYRLVAFGQPILTEASPFPVFRLESPAGFQGRGGRRARETPVRLGAIGGRMARVGLRSGG